MSKSSQAFRTIREVADWLDVAAHVLRFWESKFLQIKPVKRAGGRRYYRPADMELVGGIKVLLHDRGMTIRGVQKMIREEGVAAVAALSPPIDIPNGALIEAEIDAWTEDAAADTPTLPGAEVAGDASPQTLIPVASGQEPPSGPQDEMAAADAALPQPDPAADQTPEPEPEPDPRPRVKAERVAQPTPGTDPEPAHDEYAQDGGPAAIDRLAALLAAPATLPRDRLERLRPALADLRDRMRADVHNPAG